MAVLASSIGFFEAAAFFVLCSNFGIRNSGFAIPNPEWGLRTFSVRNPKRRMAHISYPIGFFEAAAFFVLCSNFGIRNSGFGIPNPE